MKKRFLAELRAFAPRYLLPLRVVQIVVQFLIGFYLCTMAGWSAVHFFLPFAVYIDILLDYAVFAGIGIRRQKAMEWVKSSVAGKQFIRCALLQDLFVRLVTTASGYLGVLVCGNMAEESSIFEILAPVLFLPFTILVGNLALMISHRVGGTVPILFAICIAVMIVGETLAVLVGWILFFSTRIGIEAIIIESCILTVVFAALAAFTAIRLVKDVETGYESGFTDNAENTGYNGNTENTDPNKERL